MQAPDSAPDDSRFHTMHTRHADDEKLNEKPSKTRRKREMHARQALGERLAGLEDDVIAQLPLDERLADALRAVRTLRSHEARRRQMQFIGRLMREVDLEALQAALADAGQSPRFP